MAWKKIPWFDEVAVLSDVVANTIQPDDAASAGVAALASRQDHEHAIVAAQPTGAVAVSAAAAEGTGTSFVREDHVHACPATWTPTAHEASHNDGGADEIEIDTLAGANGLAGEIIESDGLAVSFVEPDGRYDPKAHAASHKNAGADELLLHELGEPTGNIDINDQRLVKLRLEAAANATGVVADGAIFFDTDDDHVYVYVA